jgi:competence protein ComEA
MARGVRREYWGWDLPARRALASLILVLTTMIGVSAWRGRKTNTPNPRLLIDPNTCPPSVLPSLPRIGPVLASRIVEERSRRPFSSLDDLDLRVRGIGPTTAAAMRPYLRFESESPVAVASKPEPTEP